MSRPQEPSHPVFHLLSLAHDPQRALELFNERAVQRPLTLRPVSPGPESNNRVLRRRNRLLKKEHFLAHQKPRPLSAKEKRILGIYDIKKEKIWTSKNEDDKKKRTEILRQLNNLWIGYMQEILELVVDDGSGSQRTCVNPQLHGSRLASADYHGAVVEVVRSRCVGRVGIKGTVLRDNMFSFVLVGENKIWTIPKEHTVFRFEIPLPRSSSSAASNPESLVFELQGEQFKSRPADRANKKFKWRNIPDL